jgi:hypothetical protein
MTLTITLDDGSAPIVKTWCPRCGKGINHSVLRSVDERGSEECFDWHSSFQIVRCAGCETISFRSVKSNSEGYDNSYDENGGTITEYIEQEELYPPRETRGGRVFHFSGVPDPLLSVYQETIKALNANQPILAGIGIRAIIETIAKAAKAPGRNLYDKIEGLISKGVLTPTAAKALHALRILGNGAAHEAKAHKPEELNLAMDVIENLLDAVYVLPQSVRNVFAKSQENESQD